MIPKAEWANLWIRMQENDEEVPCLYMVMPYVVGGSVESAMNYGFSKVGTMAGLIVQEADI